MVARGEREARRPWSGFVKERELCKSDRKTAQFCRTFSAQSLTPCYPGAARSLRSHLPLATICRACGAHGPRTAALTTVPSCGAHGPRTAALTAFRTAAAHGF